MIRGLYTSGWSMLALEKKMDVISNNIANSSTTGYKKDEVIYESFPETLYRRVNDTRSNISPFSNNIGYMSTGNDVGEIFTYFNQGQLVSTGNKSDLAITGADTAFFTVLAINQQGESVEYYTRDGSFAVGSDGFLRTTDGYLVAGENGPVFLGDGEYTIKEDGTVVQDGNIINKLRITQFSNTENLRKIGQNLFEAQGDIEQTEFSGAVRQGYLEQSNVNVVKEMVNMITVTRSYEANQKIIQTIDSTLGKTVNEVGAV